jgi:hypothetical protein
MGVDFISGKTKAFKKGWDRAATALATPDLFRQQPSGEARQIQGDLLPGASATVGETLTVRLIETGMVAYRRDAIIAEFASPPSEVLDALRDGCGVASAKVEQVGLLGGTVRVSLK